MDIKMKYKLTKNIHTNFREYLEKENLFHYFFGHKLSNSQYNKVNYIWNTLLKQKRSIIK